MLSFCFEDVSITIICENIIVFQELSPLDSGDLKKGVVSPRTRRINMIKDSKSIKKKETGERAVKLILSCDDEELRCLRLKDVAKAVDTFIVILYIKFIIEHKITFYRFVEREKIHRAMFYLDENPAVEIEDLSRRLGFSAKPEFEEKFEKYHLIKPGRYKVLVMIRNNQSLKNNFETSLPRECRKFLIS